MNDASGDSVRAGDGRRLVLGELLKSGGAGSVYRLRDSSEQVIKIYHGDVDLALYERKVAAMLSLSPQLPDLHEQDRRYVQIAWPDALIRNERGRFLGFMMPAIDIKATSELECIMQERQARSLGLPTGLGPKITLAANLAAVIAELHRQQHRVVDLKPVNLRFYPKSLYMAMLDCDGFSIQGQGERFPAPQFTVDYLAPEFQAGGITVAGEEQQDRFALAVIVFQLLNFGIHPFTGRPTSDRVPTDVPGRIAGRCYAYGLRPSAQLQPNLVSGHAAMPNELRLLFDRAFAGPAGARPSATDWAAVLRGYAQRSNLRLTSCRNDAEHQHFAGMPCAACARAALINKTQKQGEAARSAVAFTGDLQRRPPGPRLPPPPPPPAARRGRKGRQRPLPPPRNWQQMPTSTPVSPSPSSQNFALTLAKGYHTMFGVRGWMFLFGLLYVIANMSQTAQRNQAAADPPYVPEYNTVTEPRPADPAFDAPLADTPVEDPESTTIVPIATTADLPFEQWPSMWQDLQETSRLALAVASATAQGNRTVADLGRVQLRRLARSHGQASAGDYETNAKLQYEMIGNVGAANASQRRAMRRSQAAYLVARPTDAEAACEWAWLVLIEGRRDYAEDAFIRAIWADPDYAGGWAGLGAVANDETVAFGALVLAEQLRSSPDGFSREIADFTISALDEAGLDRVRWQALQKRAKKFAAGGSTDASADAAPPTKSPSNKQKPK